MPLEQAFGSDRADFQLGVETARATISAMTAVGVLPSPRNYAVWFAHCADQSPDLSAAIARRKETGEPFDSRFAEELYQLFLASRPAADRLDHFGEQLDDSIQQVLGSIAQSATATRDYGRTLDDCSDRLGTAPGHEMQTTLTLLANETRHMSEQTRQLQQQLDRSRGEVRTLREGLVALARESLTDGLTGIANRKAFDLRLRSAAAEATDTGEPMSLLMLDIDHFKQFNDAHGHQIGDQVLRLVARTLTDSIKGGDVAARYGGEEFVIILPRTSLADAVAVAERIRASIMRRRIVRKSGGDVLGAITVSTGASAYRCGEPASDALSRADQALYLAKDGGRNCVRTESVPVARLPVLNVTAATAAFS